MTTVKRSTAGNKNLHGVISKKSNRQYSNVSPRLSKWPRFCLQVIAIVGRNQAKKLISYHTNNSHSVATKIIHLEMKLTQQREIMWRRCRRPNLNLSPRRNQPRPRPFGPVQLQQNIPIRNQCTNSNHTSQQMKICHQIKFKGNHFPKRRYL